MDVNIYSTKDYENEPRLRALGKQTQTNPIFKSEDRRQTTDDRRQTTEDRRQTTEDRRQTTEGRVRPFRPRNHRKEYQVSNNERELK